MRSLEQVEYKACIELHQNKIANPNRGESDVYKAQQRDARIMPNEPTSPKKQPEKSLLVNTPDLKSSLWPPFGTLPRCFDGEIII